MYQRGAERISILIEWSRFQGMITFHHPKSIFSHGQILLVDISFDVVMFHADCCHPLAKCENNIFSIYFIGKNNLINVDSHERSYTGGMT